MQSSHHWSRWIYSEPSGGLLNVEPLEAVTPDKQRQQAALLYPLTTTLKCWQLKITAPQKRSY